MKYMGIVKRVADAWIVTLTNQQCGVFFKTQPCNSIPAAAMDAARWVVSRGGEITDIYWQESPQMACTAWAAIRKMQDSGNERIDVMSIEPHAEMVTKYCSLLAKHIPDWDRMNPVIRIVQISIAELEGT